MTAKQSNQPCRVLYIARAPFISGAERALMSMLRHLDRANIEPMLVLGNETGLIEQAKAIDVPVTVVPLGKRGLTTFLSYRQSCQQLKKIIREFRPGILHANDVPSCQAMSELGAAMGLPRVVHVRWGITAGEMSWWARKGVERILCISRWVEETLGSTTGLALASAKVVVLPDAVDWPATQESFGTGSGNYDVSKYADQSPGGQLSLGFAGQLIESKGLDLVIEAMGKVPKDRRPRLLVAGEDTQTGGAYKTQLQQLAERQGVGASITWLGFIKDITELYRQVDMMICPSRLEPLGLVPLEAASYQKPTIANRVGGLAETIIHNETGWLVEPNTAAWVDVLERPFDATETAQMGRAAWERTRTKYSPAVYQAALMGIYRELTAKITKT